MSSKNTKAMLVATAALMFATSSAIAQVTPPVIAKAFGASTIGVGGTTTLTFTITNTIALSGVSFTDTLPAGLQVATPNGLTTTCPSGTITAVAGSTTISLTGLALAANSSCTITANVTGTTEGLKTNAVTVADIREGVGNTATAQVNVLAQPTIAKAFGASTIGVGGTTSLTITITNPNAITLTGVAFTDTLPAPLAFATPSALAATCGGVAVAATGPPATLSLSGGSLAANASCTVSANIVGTAAGTFNNTTGPVSSTQTGAGAVSNTATLVVQLPPTISKAFADSQLQLFGPGTALTFTINNPNSTIMTGIAFIDILPAGLRVDTPNGLTGSCGGGTITAVAGTNSISLSGATLAALASCTFSVNVSGVAIGEQINTTSQVTAAPGIIGNAATATTSVTDLFFMWFFRESGGGGGRP